MGAPSSQIMSCWVKEFLLETEWSALQDVLLNVLRAKLTGWSEEELSELIEERLRYVAESLRNDAAECIQDGVPLTFEIDSEESPYIRSLGRGDESLLRRLRSIDPFAFEEVCAEVFKKLGASSSVTPRTRDGGVDFIATNLNIVPHNIGTPSVCRAVVIGQAKRYQEGNIISEKALREFVGAGVWKRHKLRLESGISPLAPIILAFWTTSSFEPNAKCYAREMGIWYMDGRTLATYLGELGLRQFVEALDVESETRVTSLPRE